MWAGTSVLQSIDQSLQTVRNESLRLDSQLSSLTSNLAYHQRQKVDIVQKIAAVRLSEIEQGELQDSLNHADQKALEILDLRSQALEKLNQQIDALNKSVITTENERQVLLKNVNDLSEQLVAIEAKVQTSLKNNTEYLSRFDKASDADAISQEAERKVTQAHEDMTAKSEPYKNDALFMYLWERGFGTTEYKHKFIVRMIDSWLARLISYEKSRVNFWNLTEIPKRLTEHAEHVADTADKAHEHLQELELAALEQAGANHLELKINEARAILDNCDDNIEQIETDLNTALEKRAKFTSGEDTYMLQSLDVLSEALTHDNLRSIHRYVRATHSPTDDRLVIQLQNIQDQVEDVNDNLSDIRTLHNQHLSKLTELESIRRNFKNSRYDDARSSFTNQNLLINLLNQCVQGLVNGKDVWRAIKRNQRYQSINASSDFGSGGLSDILISETIDYTRRRSRGNRRSTWSIPSSRGSNRSAYRKSRNKRGGGFSTGGGF